MKTKTISPRPAAGSSKDERAKHGATAPAAPGLISPQDEEAAFDAYWRALLRQSPVLKAMRDHHAVRGLNLRDFRDALHDAFTAGRDSIL